MDESAEDKRIAKIGEKIKALRIEKGYTSSEFFAWEHKIPRQSYYKMESGSNITLKSLLRVLDIHGMSLEEFFKGL